MYVFGIVEIELIIFSYLDYCVDFSVLKRVSKNYRNIVNDHQIYNKLCDFKYRKSKNIEFKFNEACGTDIFIAKYLFYKYPRINIHNNYENPFFKSCLNGHLDIAQWLWSLDNNIKLYIGQNDFFWQTYDYIFYESCSRGHLNIAKWLWNLSGKIDLHADNELIFRHSCEKGRLDIVKWLWSLDGKTNLHAAKEYAFNKSWKNRHLDVVQWLWQLDDKIDLRFFKKRHQLEIIEWAKNIDRK